MIRANGEVVVAGSEPTRILIFRTRRQQVRNQWIGIASLYFVVRGTIGLAGIALDVLLQGATPLLNAARALLTRQISDLSGFLDNLQFFWTNAVMPMALVCAAIPFGDCAKTRRMMFLQCGLLLVGATVSLVATVSELSVHSTRYDRWHQGLAVLTDSFRMFGPPLFGFWFLAKVEDLRDPMRILIGGFLLMSGILALPASCVSAAVWVDATVFKQDGYMFGRIGGSSAALPLIRCWYLYLCPLGTVLIGALVIRWLLKPSWCAWMVFATAVAALLLEMALVFDGWIVIGGPSYFLPWIEWVALASLLIFVASRCKDVDLSTSPHCGTCGYSLRGVSGASGRCPECGTQIEMPAATQVTIRDSHLGIRRN